MSRKITKVSFKNSGSSGVEIKYTTFDAAGLKDKTGKEVPHAPHITFQKAMEKMVSHLLFLTEFELESKFKKLENFDIESAKDFRVCGVSISGEGDKEGVVITGYKTLSNGMGFVFNTPNTKLNPADGAGYKFVKDLVSDLGELEAEALEYLAGKYGAVQGDLFPADKSVEEG